MFMLTQLSKCCCFFLNVYNLNPQKSLETFLPDQFHIYLRPACMIYYLSLFFVFKMAPLTLQSDISRLSYSHEQVSGFQTKSHKISQYLVLILLNGVEKLMKEWVNELMTEGIKCCSVSKMMAISSFLLCDPSAFQWNNSPRIVRLQPGWCHFRYEETC